MFDSGKIADENSRVLYFAPILQYSLCRTKRAHEYSLRSASMNDLLKSGRFTRLLVAASPLLIASVAGCGGGGGAITKAAALSGTVTVPSGTPTRGVSGSIPLPGATVNLYDITNSGVAALSGTPSETTTSDSSGNYSFSNTTAGHSYIATF